jgi:hypothetical protein
MRDTILAIGGKLNQAVGGPSVNLAAEPYPTRRTIYGYIDRVRLPGMLQAFDFASPDLTTGKRPDTIVPQQALFMMNSSLVVEQARNLSHRRDFMAKATAEEKVKMLYQLIYQRAPRDTELKMALDYVRAESVQPIAPKEGEPLWLYGYGELDPVKRTPKQFINMPTFAGSWNAQTMPGDMRSQTVSLSGGGGSTVGKWAVIRRWVAPKEMTLSIDGTLGHSNKDKTSLGVQGRIVLGRGETAGTIAGPFTAYNKGIPTKVIKLQVKAGDELDFIVDARGGAKNDNFSWAPVIKNMAGPGEWSAAKEFGGTTASDKLTAWEKFAQILLQTNELTFIN